MFSLLLLTENRNKLPGNEMEHFNFCSLVKMLPKLYNAAVLSRKLELALQEELAAAQLSPCVCRAFVATHIIIKGPNFALLSASTPLIGTGKETHL